MAEFHFNKYKTVDGNTFSSVLEIFTKRWYKTELTKTIDGYEYAKHI